MSYVPGEEFGELWGSAVAQIKKDLAQEQFNRFRDTARALECVEDEAKFDEALKRVARHKGKSQFGEKRDDKKDHHRNKDGD